MNKPYATDWIQINETTQYSANKRLYWSNNQIYDELSAQHNGIIGQGFVLKTLLKG